MVWRCSTCKTVVKGRFKAEGGSDWQCKYCGSHQFRVDDACSNCIAKQGESRNQPTKWDDGKVGPAGGGLTALEEIQQADREEIRDAERGLEGKLSLSDTEPPVYERILADELRERRTKRKATYRRSEPFRTPAPTSSDVEPELPRLPIDRRKPFVNKIGENKLGRILMMVRSVIR
jgi:hypothetical protein